MKRLAVLSCLLLAGCNFRVKVSEATYRDTLLLKVATEGGNEDKLLCVRSLEDGGFDVWEPVSGRCYRANAN